MSYFAKLQQSVSVSAGNSSTDNLDASATFTGSKQDTLGVAGLQINLYTTQNCTIYVDQSMTATPNWDITDTYDYYASKGGMSFTVQATASYMRVRVTNLSATAATTTFRLQTALCPIVEAVPRSLDNDGYLKTSINHIIDEYGFSVENTPMDQMRVAQATRLVGAIFTGSTLDTNFWTSTLANGGTATLANAQLRLRTNTTASGSAIIQTVRTARYVSMNANWFRTVIQNDSGVASNKRIWGATDGTDGCYFYLDGSTFGVATLKGGAETAVASGSFNGTVGSTYDPGTTVHTYEIYWTNSAVWFAIGGELIHKVSASSTTWTNTMHLPARASNTNTTINTDKSLYVRTMAISRLGQMTTQPISKYQAGTTAGLVLKYGPGNVHGINVSGVVNNSVVTLYDNTAGTGTIIWSSGAMSANTVPLCINLWGAAFSTGLTLVISAANANAMVTYE